LRGNVTILPFDDTAAGVYGALRAQLERQGTPLAEPDLRIAAVALANDLILVTGNVRHFARVPGLPIENWLAPS
jgi:tRNA(fMet)-specific endonuclease VapC